MMTLSMLMPRLTAGVEEMSLKPEARWPCSHYQLFNLYFPVCKTKKHHFTAHLVSLQPPGMAKRSTPNTAKAFSQNSSVSAERMMSKPNLTDLWSNVEITHNQDLF